jgi:hypothetical protein
VFDWTDAKHPKEIAYFDRGPLDSTKLELGGYWSTYWYNGLIVGSEITRGLDIFELKPSGFISQNEIDAAKSVHFDYLNAQGQTKLVWPRTYSLARAYLDQLERSNSMETGRIVEFRAALDRAEKAPAAEQRKVLADLATRLKAEAGRAGDPAKAQLLAGVVSQLATGTSLASRQ